MANIISVPLPSVVIAGDVPFLLAERSENKRVINYSTAPSPEAFRQMVLATDPNVIVMRFNGDAKQGVWLGNGYSLPDKPKFPYHVMAIVDDGAAESLRWAQHASSSDPAFFGFTFLSEEVSSAKFHATVEAAIEDNNAARKDAGLPVTQLFREVAVDAVAPGANPELPKGVVDLRRVFGREAGPRPPGGNSGF